MAAWYRMDYTRGQCTTRRVSADPLRRCARQARETDLAGAWIRKESDGLQRFLMAHGLDAAAAQAKVESTYCQLWTPKADSSAVPHPPHPRMHLPHSSGLGAPALPALTLILPVSLRVWTWALNGARAATACNEACVCTRLLLSARVWRCRWILSHAGGKYGSAWRSGWTWCVLGVAMQQANLNTTEG